MNRWQSLSRTLSAALLGSSGAVLAAPALSPLTLSYDVAWGNTPLGQGVLALTAEATPDCYRYELRTHPIGLVRWLYGSPRETSQFCVVDGSVQVSRMEFHNPKRPKDNFVLDFDWAQQQLRGGRNGPLAIAPGTLDRLSVQQAARLWVKAKASGAKGDKLQLSVADHKRVKTYTFAITGRGEVITPAGAFQAVRFERVDEPNTTLRFWLAPEKDYMPVKVEHVEDGEVKLRMSLQKTDGG